MFVVHLALPIRYIVQLARLCMQNVDSARPGAFVPKGQRVSVLQTIVPRLQYKLSGLATSDGIGVVFSLDGARDESHEVGGASRG